MVMLELIWAFSGYNRYLFIFLAGDFDVLKIHVALLWPNFAS